MEQIKKESAQETSLLIVAEAERLYAAGNYRATYQYLKSEMTYVSENERALTLLVLAGQGLNGHTSSRSLKKYVFIVVSIFLVLALAFGILVYMQSPLIERVGEGSVINKESAGSYDKRVEKLREQLRKKTGTRSEDTLLIIPGTHPGDTLYEENIDEN